MTSKLKAFFSIILFFRMGIGFIGKIKLFVFSLARILFFPIALFDYNSYVSFVWNIFPWLKNLTVSYQGKYFCIGNGGDLSILKSEKEEIDFLSGGGSVFIDLGAHMGKYSILLADKFKKIVAVEASPDNFLRLQKGITLNQLLSKVVCINKAAYNKDGEVLNFNLVEDNLGAGSVVDSGQKNIQVESCTVDRLLDDLKIDRREVDFVKIDVEGAEIFVLDGMKKLLELGSPKLIIEIWPDKKERKEGVELFLKKFGYNLISFRGDNYLASK